MGAALRSGELGRWSARASASVNLRPAPDLRLSIGSRLVMREKPRQYVATLPDGPSSTFGRRYVFARIDRTTLSAELRLDYAFAPGLSPELFAQPFAARGDYDRFGRLQDAGGKQLLRYGQEGTSIETLSNGSFRARSTSPLVNEVGVALMLRHLARRRDRRALVTLRTPRSPHRLDRSAAGGANLFHTRVSGPIGGPNPGKPSAPRGRQRLDDAPCRSVVTSSPASPSPR